MSRLTSDLKEFAAEIGLDVIKITSAEPFIEVARRIEKQTRSDPFIDEYWKIEAIDAFCSPQSVLPEAKSVVVAAECYLTSELEDLGSAGNPHGLIARYTRRNYYHDTETKLKKVAKFLKRKGFQTHFKSYSCGPLAEKPMAERAGVGWYGKDGIIMTEKYGSLVVLGELLTDVELEVDEPLVRSCGECRVCIESCPTSAIVSPYILDRSKCLQHITNQKRAMSVEIREMWGNRLYGCTTCQDVCPLNRKVKPKERKPEYGYVGPSIPLIPLLEMSEVEYREHFRHNQMGAGWINFESIQRNAAVALGNIGDPAAIPVLIQSLRSPYPIVRGHSAWSLGKIGGKEAKISLEMALKNESNPEVVKEIKDALEKAG